MPKLSVIISRSTPDLIVKHLKVEKAIIFLGYAVINQFSPATLRQDTGALWENFVISERVKFLAYNQINCNQYFWRTHAQQEIDYIEEGNGCI